MALEEYFDKIFCINLQSRKDRWNECLMEFEKHGIIGVTRFEAIVGNLICKEKHGDMGLKEEDPMYEKKLTGRLGCLNSHLSLIKLAKAENLNRILILEDDVQFANNIQKTFRSISKQIPGDWSLLYLGGNEKAHQTKITQNILKVNHMLMGHAVGINCGVYDKLIHLLSQANHPADVYYAMIQKEYQCYTIYPYLAWQRSGWSDLEQRFRIYDFENMSPSLSKMLKCKEKG